jgi:hypothetical protein
MSKINLIPEVEADWAGMLKVAERIMYSLVAANFVLVVYLVVTSI